MSAFEAMLNSESSSRPTNFVFLLLPRLNSLTLSNLVEPLRIANYCAGQPVYEWSFMSADGKDVVTSTGIKIPTLAISYGDNPIDVIVICGGWNSERYNSAELNSWLHHMGRRGVKLGAVETGTYVLAKAGLLAGYSATIHWHCHTAFEESYTNIDFRDVLVVRDRQRITCSGGSACLDMMLQEIEADHGKALAGEVADQLVYYPVRKASAPQKSLQNRKHAFAPPEVQRAIDLMGRNIERPLTIPELSRKLGFSQRKLERLFKKNFECSAVAFYRVLRLQEARVLLTHTDMSVLDICIACGFASSSYFSKSYTNQFGVRPRDHRLSWPENEPAPLWPGMTTSRLVSAETSRLKNGRQATD
jgi:AraC family carnitine catabolism transcriptional activator